MDEDDSPINAILAYVSEERRDEMLHELIRALRLDDQSSVNFVASLVVHHSNQENKRYLLLLLERTIRIGQVDCAVSASLRLPELGHDLLSAVAEALQAAKSSDGEALDEAAIRFYLSFAKLALSQLPCGDAHTHMLHVSLNLLHNESVQCGKDARDVVFALLSLSDATVRKSIILPSLEHIWSATRSLVSSDMKPQTILGYSLWLRLLFSVQPEDYRSLITSDYWQLLLTGMRKGDTEGRKLCLSILRTTTAADSAAVSHDERAQFIRYCTVFETIVLGRYINQVQECERDLDLLVSKSSLDSQWLFTLLASALDSHMQESNRKFIGNWILRATWEPTHGFLNFLRDDFLPWVMQGALFVSSLRTDDGQLRCVHGDRLSKFLRMLLESCNPPDLLTDIVTEIIRQKRNSMFTYTLVYLLEGVAATLTHDQKVEIAGISGLPEVARDYVAFRTAVQMNGLNGSKTVSRREAREQTAIAKCESFNAEVDDIEDLWNELDYLEYPKALITLISGIILQPVVVARSFEDQNLAESLLAKLEALLDIAHTKTYLFSPLVVAVRKAIASNPAAVEILGLEKFVVKIAQNPPVSTIDLMLEEATTHLTRFSYEHYFGPRPAYGFAALVDLVSRLRGHASVVENIIFGLLKRWKSQNIPPPTVSPWKNKLQLQILLLCFEQYDPPALSQIHDLLNDLFHVLAIEPLPQYRYLLEWIIIRMITRFQLQRLLLERLSTKDHHSNPKHLASLMKIGVILSCEKDAAEEFTLQLATSFVPLAASSKIVIRHEAQWQVPLLMDHARNRNWTQITDNPAFVALDDYIRSLERFHDPPPERKSGRFDIGDDHTLTNLVEGKWLALDSTEKPLTTHEEFVKLYSADSDLILPPSCMPLGLKVDHLSLTLADEEPTAPMKQSIGPQTADNISALQTKGAAYLARTLSDHTLLDCRPNNLIVVASLVDNPYNLGGLSRVSEIFGASALCLQNQNVVSNKDFISVAVSSHLHFPIVQLSAQGVPDFLAERKKEGFTVVGIEQTDRSVILGSGKAVLPEKVVLVVGSEKEGIPAVVLTECDVLVEIPQQGITRSLNVQTAVAIVLFEYARQRRGV